MFHYFKPVKAMKIFKASYPYLQNCPRLTWAIENTIKTVCVLIFPAFISIFVTLI